MTKSNYNLVTLQQLMDDTQENNDKHKVLRHHVISMLAENNLVANIAFNQFQLDSRQVGAQDVFVLLKSQTPNCQNSRHYIRQAAQNAAFILSEIDPKALFTKAYVPPHKNIQLDDCQDTDLALSDISCPIVYVPSIRDFLGDLIQSRMQYQHTTALPAVIAVTGTNGKTTISQLVAQLTQLVGMSSAVMGTAGNGRLGALVQASHTTGDALAVQQFLYRMGQEQADLLTLEASSHGLDQQRLQGVPVSIAVYTNLSRDHLDYHANMREYAEAKAKLFDRTHFPALTHAIINSDDEHAQIIIDTAKASDLIVWTYSLQPKKPATFNATYIKPSLEGVQIALHSEFGDITIISPLLGLFNVSNLLAAIAATIALGVDVERIANVIPKLQGAIGRMQRVPSIDGCFIVDYAHTPDALSQVLSSLRTHCNGQLWAVFGCGGDRDAGKRPLMAQAGLSGADKVILTADNPRTEDPNTILQDMQLGMTDEQYKRIHVEPARKLAIDYVVTHAKADDIVVIAGKGHETYQEINHVRHDFDDRIVLAQALKRAQRL